MAGISALISKLRSLQNKTKPEIKKVSVIFYDQEGNVDLPENINESGVLLVPRPMTVQEWEAYCAQEIELTQHIHRTS